MPAPLQEHPYADLLLRVAKPQRYVGGEQGEIRKDWDAAAARVCLAFPDVYEVGMSHLGFKILYSLINGAPDLLAERVYAPWSDMEALLRERSETLRSLENARSLRDFDVVGFSLQFELSFTNILLMLDLGGIALRSAERPDDAPLVIAGGPTATHPEPLAPFIDAFVIGDGEEVTPLLVRSWSEQRRAGVPRAERLRALSKLPGVYVPSLYATALDPATGLHYVVRGLDAEAPLPVRRAHVGDLARYPFPKDGPVASTETVFDRVSVEIARGCTEGCRFCQAGMIYRPVRERAPQEVLDVVDHAINGAGYDSVSLTSLSTADYSAISPLVHAVTAKLKPARAKLAVSSLRAYGLSEDVLDELKETGGGGLTFAPEAGTQRMRDVVNKNVTEEQLLETARRVFSRGWSKMKLYFMIGLPTETDEDVLGIVQTGARARAVGRSLGMRGAQVTCSASTHVPKPHTPFQWCAMDDKETVLRKQQLLRDEARRTGVDLKMHASDGSFLEGVVARGDRTIAAVIEGAYLRGARFDSWEERLDLGAWRAAFEAAGVDPQRFLGTIPTDAKLPWDHIDVGLEPGFLAKEYRKALKNRLSPPCGKAVKAFVHHTNLEEHTADTKRLVCYDCGVACDLDAMRSERATFLVSLGALRPRAPRSVASAEAAPAEATPEGTVPGDSVLAKSRGTAFTPKKRPPIREDQGPGIRVRLCFEKLGRAAFGSHLDLVRLLPRLFRRIGLPLYYSLGYHPKPVMIFGPALPLGVQSLGEHIDIKLATSAPLDLDTLPARLNESSLDGVRFTQALLLGDADAKLGRLMDEAVYVAGLPRAALEALGLGGTQELTAHVATRRQGPLVVRRDVDGIGKRIDVGRVLLDVQVGKGADVLERAGLRGELVPLTLRIRLAPDGSAKAIEALEALLGRDVPARIVRSELLCRRGDEAASPTELAKLRALLAAAEVRDTLAPS
jgi:radical SAM family uncharacterized protein/radical SAM-linked protein